MLNWQAIMACRERVSRKRHGVCIGSSESFNYLKILTCLTELLSATQSISLDWDEDTEAPNFLDDF